MNDNLKKIIAGIIGAGAIAGGSIIVSNKIDCDYELRYQEETLCISKEIKEAIESQLKPNSGFGGIKFGG